MNTHQETQTHPIISHASELVTPVKNKKKLSSKYARLLKLSQSRAESSGCYIHVMCSLLQLTGRNFSPSVIMGGGLCMVHVLMMCHPDMTFAVDWALNNNYLLILSILMGISLRSVPAMSLCLQKKATLFHLIKDIKEWKKLFN